jgi:hypothetical protein
MLANVDMRKSAGFCLAVMLGLCVAWLVVPQQVSAQEHPTTTQGAHPDNVGFPKLFTEQSVDDNPVLQPRANVTAPYHGPASPYWGNPYWANPALFGESMMCGGNLYSPFYSQLAAFSPMAQAGGFPWMNGTMQGIPGGPDLMSWSSYGSPVGLWSTSPAVSGAMGYGAPCGAFQGW